ncbi:bifunctional DNA primase/polymerase [Mycobacterium sp. E740]|uniref:bifunctional DNA primase/polymerase n=1 Tax=Mycobacterium sp. E740 TaxID=1834149 RepID=UPI0009ECEC86
MNANSMDGSAAYLDFYLTRGCVVVPCQPGTKKLVRGAGEWTAEASRAECARLGRNAAMRNGTGGLLVVDVDAKHGGSLDLMAERFPGSTDTRMIQTVSPGPDGLGLQLLYSLPDGFRIRPSVLDSDANGRPRIEVASFAMLPGSRARGADKVMRTYEVVRDMSPSPATPDLLAAVEARSVIGAEESLSREAVDPAGARARLDVLLARIAAAGEGQRNDAFLENALPVVRLCAVLGEDPETLLTMAYDQSGGRDDATVAAAIRRAIQRAAEEPAGRLGLGPLAHRQLVDMSTWARFARWPGQSGPSDRRVYLAVVGACLEQSRTDTALGTRNLALRAGLAKETVEASLKRLAEAGRLHVVKVGMKPALVPGSQRVQTTNFVVRSPMLSPEDNTHILPPLVMGITNRDVCVDIDPLHMVWSVPRTEKGAGLNGRHGHLFDLVCAGLTTARALGEYIGSRPDSLSRTLKRLVDVGLLGKSGNVYVPADNVAPLADRLALELGGVAACAHRENQYRDEAQQWRETQEQWEKDQKQWEKDAESRTETWRWGKVFDYREDDPWARIVTGYLVDPFTGYPRDPFEPNAYLEDPFEEKDPAPRQEATQPVSEQFRRWYEEQLLLDQLGLPNELI